MTDLTEDGRRERFEAWMKKEGLDFTEYDLEIYAGLEDREYINRIVQDYWVGWQAAWTARAARESESEIEIRADERNRMQVYIEKRARKLMLEHYDADLYKRALEEHLKLCIRPIIIERAALSETQPEERIE